MECDVFHASPGLRHQGLHPGFGSERAGNKKKNGSPFLCGTVCRVVSWPEDSESDYFSVSCQLASRTRRMISSGTEPSARTEIQLFLFM